MTLQEMQEAIEKAASESNTDHYICPFCYARRPKEHVVVHKRACTGLR
jgi:ribosomal protein L40E